MVKVGDTIVSIDNNMELEVMSLSGNEKGIFMFQAKRTEKGLIEVDGINPYRNFTFQIKHKGITWKPSNN